MPLINKASFDAGPHAGKIPIDQFEQAALAHLRPLVENPAFAGLTPDQIAGVLNASFPRTVSIFHGHFVGMEHCENAVQAEDVAAALGK